MRGLGLTLVALTMGGCEPFFGGPLDITFQQVSVQAFEGIIIVEALDSPNPEEALGAELNDVGRMFARPPLDQGEPQGEIAAPGIEQGYLERWTYADRSVHDSLTASGFVLRLDEVGNEPTCAFIDKVMTGLGWSTPAFAEQSLEYVNPPDSPVDLAVAASAATFEVYQPVGNDIELRGWLFRGYDTQSNAYHDHWLLADNYEALGDGGEVAIVAPLGEVDPDSFEDWFASNAGEAGSYTEATYGISVFPDGCEGP